MWAPGGDSYVGNIWHSADGKNWNPNGLGSVNSMAFSPSGRLGVAFDSRTSQVYLSRNSGASWHIQQVTDGRPLAFAVPSDNVAYVVFDNDAYPAGVLWKFDN
jgi:hypothetical protein